MTNIIANIIITIFAIITAIGCLHSCLGVYMFSSYLVVCKYNESSINSMSGKHCIRCAQPISVRIWNVGILIGFAARTQNSFFLNKILFWEGTTNFYYYPFAQKSLMCVF